MTSPASQLHSTTMSSAVSVTSSPAEAMSVPSSVPPMSLPSALPMALTSAGSVALSAAVDLSLPHASQVSVCPSVSSLPGFSSFLPGYKTPHGLQIVLTSKTPTSRIQSSMPVPGSNVRASNPVTYTHGASLLSTGTSAMSSHVRSVTSSGGAFSVVQPTVPRHSTAVGPASESLYHSVSSASEAGAVLNETAALTVSMSKESSPGIFRPVGVLLKKTWPDKITSSLPPSTHMACQARENSSAFMHCRTPPANQVPWTSNYNDGNVKDNWTFRTTYDACTCDSKVQIDPQNQPYPNSQMYVDSKSPTSYGMYPFSQVYTSNQAFCSGGQEATKGRMMARTNSGVTFEENNSSAFCGSKTSPPFLYDSRNDTKNIAYLNDSGDTDNSRVKAILYPRNRGECADGTMKNNPYTSTKVECVTNNVSVVTVRANDNSLFMASPTGTTSQTESEFSLHDAKMQLAEDPPLSEPALPPQPPPPSPYSSHNVMSCGGVADKRQPQPTPGEEVKPHPGLDMLSDVSLLVESLTSQASGVKGSDSQCTASSTIASSLMTCCPYPPMEDTDTTLCPPQATYVGSLPSDPDSTMPHITSSHVDGSIMPDDDLEYTAMHPPPVLDGCCTHIEDPQEQYTSMLPPKKSTKFTRGACMESLPVSSTGNSCKPCLFLKLSSGSTKNTSEKLHGKHRKMDYQDADMSKTEDGGKKKRGRPKKHKDSVGNCVSSTEAIEHSQATHQKTKVKRKKNKYQVQLSPPNGCDTKESEDSSHMHVIAGKNITGSSQNAENSLAAQPGPVHGCVLSSPVSQQASAGAEATMYHACESDQYQNRLTHDKQLLMSPPDSIAAASGESSHSHHEPDSLQTDEDSYEGMSLKVHFDPLVIAEEEVTSTQSHNLIHSDDNTNLSSGDSGQIKTTKRRRSHICVSCFSIPSSDDEESLSPSSVSMSTKLNSADGGSSKDGSRKSNTRRVVKSDGVEDNRSVMCAVCSRTFSNSSNLARHQRVFHPSLFITNTPIMELPLTSPHSHKQPDSFSSSLNLTNNSSPSPIPSVNISLRPPSPFIMQSLKPPSTLPSYIPPTDSASACPPVYDVRVKSKAMTSQHENTDPQQAGHSSKRRRLKRKVKKQDEDWEPPTQRSKKKKGKSDVGQMKAEPDRKMDRTRQQTTTPQKEGRLRPKQMTPTSQRPQRTMSSRVHPLRCVLNFRTKKRTRVNSTIPCPYCDHLFSVMSNLKRHTKQQHQDVNVFACNVCSFKINMRRKLNKHMKRNHAETFPYSCGECLAMFRSEPEMTSHERSHEIQRFPCEGCDLVFYTEEHLDDHMAHYHVQLQISD